MQYRLRRFYIVRVKHPAIRSWRWFKRGWRSSWRFRIASVSLLFIAVLILQILPQAAILPTPKASAASHQFTPVAGQMVTGTAVNANGHTTASAEGMNVGSWKGTLGDDNYHWQVTSTTSGYDVNLTLGGVALNGANTMFVQTDFDLDATVPSTVVQVCDWVSSTSVDNGADAACSGGGWRTLNNRKQGITTATPNVGYTWQIYDGYWSDGSNNTVSTPLTNFISGSNQAKVRYYSTTNTTSTVSIDYVKMQAVINPVYAAGDFTNQGGGSTTNDYTNTTAIHQGASDDQYLQFAGDAGSAPEGYFTFKNIKTYTGMNTALARLETSCSAATANLRYTIKIRNFNTSSWENISDPIDCSTTDATNAVAKSSVTLSNYISGGEMWVQLQGSANSTTSLRVDQMYLQLGSTQSSTGACEVSFGTQTAGRVLSNPSTNSDEPTATTVDSSYLYVAGYDTAGGDTQWRIEKRNKSDGALVSGFGANGVVQEDPSSDDDRILSIEVDSSYLYVAGYDNSASDEQIRIEKRDISTGALVTAFDGDGIYTDNPNGTDDRAVDIAIDGSYVYAVSRLASLSGGIRYTKLDITTGIPDSGFDGDGILDSTNGTDRLNVAAVRVNGSSIITTGMQAANTGAINTQQYRLEKRDIATGAVDTGFDGDGVLNINPTASSTEGMFDLDIDGSYIYTAGMQSDNSDPKWRIDKLDISSGAAVGAFGGSGAAFVNTLTSQNPQEYPSSIRVDGSYVYIAGSDVTDFTSRRLQVSKFDITAGTVVTAFSSNGHARSVFSGDEEARGLAIDGSHVYTVGYGNNNVDMLWMIEKHDITTGLSETSGFGPNDCTAAATINTTGTDPSVWRLQTEDESNNQGHDFYAGDTDGDGTAEEAAAANINFDATLGSAAQMTGLFYAGQFNGGTGSTVQLGGFSDVGGGWAAVGSTATSNLTYTDNITAGGSAAAGMQANADSYIDTNNNRLNLRLRTTVDSTATSNSVYDIDFVMASMQWVETTITPSKKHVFLPTGNNLTTGTAQNVAGATGANGEGTNLGSWRGLLSPDGYHWTFASTSSGINAQVDFGGVALNGANSIMFQTTWDQDATTPTAVMQVCDWVSSASVDNAADAACTGGGWRSVNNRKAGANNTSPGTFTWQIYDGFWNASSNTAVSTPLSNFVNGSNLLKVRFYATTNTTTTFALDSVAALPMINSLYSPAGLTNLGSGTVTNTYSNANSYVGAAIGSGSSAQFPSDDNRVGVAGTAGSISDSYFSFKNIKTTPGMNTIVVRAEHRCNNTGINYKPKIYNYQSGLWEDLSTANIACSGADATNIFAKNNVDLSNYLNNGEARIGWYGLSNSTIAIETDLIYVMVGMTNTDTSECEISFGTLSAGGCGDTRDIDTPGTTSSWNILAEDESTNQGHDFYGYDTDNSTGTAESKAAHVKFNVPYLTNGPMIGFNWGFRYLSGVSGTVQGGVRDYGASAANLGGFSQVGNTGANTYTYTDPFASSSPLPYFINPESHRDPLGERMWARMRTSSSSIFTNDTVAQWDFAFIAPIWIETSTHGQPQVQEQLRHGGSFRNGVEQPMQL